MSDPLVRDQYEGHPYPPRNPADEKKRLIVGSPSHLDELNHFVFAGRRDFLRPFRALVAGGGTGDAVIMLAQQLKDAGTPSEVVYTDISVRSRAIAEARARVRGLTNIRFESRSILDLPGSDLGRFDYIDCCGVLHHLAEPSAGLDALVAVLEPDGGMGLMLYGELGRSGVYPVQDMLRILAPADAVADKERLAWTRRLLSTLPESNLLCRNPFVADHRSGDDACLFDLFLHAQDRAYRVPEILHLVRGARLRLLTFLPTVLYDPRLHVRDERMRDRLNALSPQERMAFGELLLGSLRKHTFYVVKATNPVSPPEPDAPNVVPVLIDMDGAVMADRLSPGASLTVTMDGVTIRCPLPDLSGAILRRVDGSRTVQSIHEAAQADGIAVTWADFSDQFRRLYEVLNSVGKMVLRLRS